MLQEVGERLWYRMRIIRGESLGRLEEAGLRWTHAQGSRIYNAEASTSWLTS